MSHSEIFDRLQQGIAQMKLALTDDQITSLVAYLELLEKWNKTYNLTAVREPLQMVGNHLLDSLSVDPHLKGSKIVDIGSGAGLPGIPLAIKNPDKEFLLLDSNSKKTRFMLHAANQLGLTNVGVFHGRAEDYQAEAGFDTVVCRALAVLPKLVSWGGHMLNDNGVLVAQKGHYPESELEQLPPSWTAISHRIDVPFLDNQERHIIVMHHTNGANQ